MSVYLQCRDTGRPSYENPNWATCLCDGCMTYRKQLNKLDTNTPMIEESPGSKEWWDRVGKRTAKSVSDGSTASYYELPSGATELQDLISFRNMNAQLGEIFRACYRYGQASHSSCLRDAKKIQFYINAEIERLERWGQE